MKPLISILTGLVMMTGVAFGETGLINNDINNQATANSEGLFNNFSGGHVNQNFEGSTPVPYLPGTLGAPAISPTLFSLQGLPAQVAGLPLLSKNFFSVSVHDVAIGRSNGTKIIYNGALLPLRKIDSDRTVTFDFNGVSKGEVVGSMTIQSRKHKADEVDVSTLIYDALQYVENIKSLKGYNVTLLTVMNTLSYATGVDSRGSGFSISPLVSGFINGPAGALAGLASGFSKSGGVTVPTAIVGCTFLVIADTGNESTVDLTKNYVLSDNKSSNGNGNGNGKKKYEAVKDDQ